MIENIKLPQHWQVKKLGEVCEIIMGQSPPSATYNYSGIGLPFFQGKAEFTELYPVVEKWCNTPNKISLPNDILLSVRAPVGTTNIANQKCCIGRGLAAIRYQNYKYIFYFLRSIAQQLDKKGTGTTFRAISGETIRTTEIPLPPFPEQQLIVSKIEELLSDLDNGKQQLQTAQQQLKVYRQSLLKWAFEGKLTKTLSKWQNVKFDEVANAIDPQPSHRTPPIVYDGIPYVSIKDFDSEVDKIDFTFARRVSTDVLKEHLNRYKLELGDFVIGKIGTIGKPVRIVLPQDYTLSANIVLIQPRKVNATYLYYFFQSSLIEKAFTAGMKATTQAAFGIQKVRELRIELPSANEQQLIVDELESKLTVCDKIEETISQSLLQAETLRQSILKKAFEGKLVSLNCDSDDELDKNEMGMAAEPSLKYKKSDSNGKPKV